MYKYTYDFNVNGGSFQNLNFIFSNFGVPNTFIEIGIFEGATTFHVSDTYTPFNKNLKIFAIDPHMGSIDMLEEADTVAKYFTHNLAINKHKNIEYIRKPSTKGLIDLINRNQTAEVIYIDGDHRADQVLTDLILSWQILVVGGIILCDDTGSWKYTDTNGSVSAQMSPRMGVEFFIQAFWHKLTVIKLPNNSQTAILKNSN